jgi:hypothetical protein
LLLTDPDAGTERDVGTMSAVDAERRRPSMAATEISANENFTDTPL